MVRAMFPVPMRVMLLMRYALFLFSRCRSVSFVPGQAQASAATFLGQLPRLSRHLRLVFRR
jgi:hypothetical protein